MNELDSNKAHRYSLQPFRYSSKFSFMINKKVFQALLPALLLVVTVMLPTQAYAAKPIVGTIIIDGSGTFLRGEDAKAVAFSVKGKMVCDDEGNIVEFRQFRGQLTVDDKTQRIKHVEFTKQGNTAEIIIQTRSLGTLTLVDDTGELVNCIYLNAGIGFATAAESGNLRINNTTYEISENVYMTIYFPHLH